MRFGPSIVEKRALTGFRVLLVNAVCVAMMPIYIRPTVQVLKEGHCISWQPNGCLVESQIIVISVYYVIEAFFNFKIVTTMGISIVVNASVGEYVEKSRDRAAALIAEKPVDGRH
jgi:hypothetical protein